MFPYRDNEAPTNGNRKKTPKKKLGAVWQSGDQENKILSFLQTLTKLVTDVNAGSVTPHRTAQPR